MAKPISRINQVRMFESTTLYKHLYECPFCFRHQVINLIHETLLKKKNIDFKPSNIKPSLKHGLQVFSLSLQKSIYFLKHISELLPIRYLLSTTEEQKGLEVDG